MVKGLLGTPFFFFFVWGIADKDGSKHPAALTQPVQHIWLHQTYLPCAVHMASIHTRKLKCEMCRGTSPAIRNQSFCPFPDRHSSHMKVQINNFSSGKLKGMSALTMLAIDNLKNFWKIFLKLYQLFHVQTEHEMNQAHPSHDEKGNMYPFIPRRATFKTDSTILPQSWSSNVPALFWRSQHLIVSLWLQESLKEILSTVA